jgi:hydroxymethylbilane synthase
VAALGLPYDSGLRLWALVASPDGTRVVRADGTGSLADPEALGAEVGAVLMQRGAGELLELAAQDVAPKLSHP